MENVKNELQNIIQTNGAFGGGNIVKTIQNFLRRNEKSNRKKKGSKQFKSEEEKELICFINEKSLWYDLEIEKENFLDAGAEQRVYRFDDNFVIKLNDSVFYETWLDYFNSLLVH